MSDDLEESTVETLHDGEENTNEKGNRHENEAKDILKRVYGAGVEKVDAWGNTDPFGFVDLVAMQPGEPVLFVQVKTNGFSQAEMDKYRSRLRILPTDHARFEVWVRHDRTGWVLFEFSDGVFQRTQEINICDTSEAREMYASQRQNGGVQG